MMSKVKVLICPYCGETQPAGERCRACSGLFEPLSRQATLNAMGPWHLRDENRPFQPGCSYETLVRMVEQGRVTRFTIIRGPTTKQLWQVARRVPGIAHLMGYCHHCDVHVDAKNLHCSSCGAAFGAYLDRNHLGLPDLNPLPWDADDDEAASTGAFRQYFTPPKPQATGISSFAHDEELIETSDRFSEQESGLAAVLGGSLTAEPDEYVKLEALSTVDSGTAMAPRTETIPLADSLTEFETYAVKARQRALERRLKQQRNLVRIFGALFFITAFFALALQLGWIGASDGVAHHAGQDESRQPTSEDVSSGVVQPDSQEPTDDIGPKTPVAVPPESLPTLGGDSSATLQPRDNRPQPYSAEYEHAMALVKRSIDGAIDLDERIGHVTQAVQILENIRDNADRSLWPNGLEFEIERQKRRIVELKQSKFFG